MGNKKDSKSNKMTLEEFLWDPSIGILEFFVRLIHWVQINMFGVKDVVGNEIFIGQFVTIIDLTEDGVFYVMIENERWKLICNKDLSVGDNVKIIAVEGLSLIGERAEI